MTVENRTSALANAQLAADDDIDLSNILGTLWRGKLWIALAGFLTLVVGAWYAFAVAVPVYTTSASVVLETRKQNVMDIDSVVTGLSGDMATINTEVEVFLSRKLRKQVVEALDLLQYPEFNYTLREKRISSTLRRVATNSLLSVANSCKSATVPDRRTSCRKSA